MNGSLGAAPPRSLQSGTEIASAVEKLL